MHNTTRPSDVSRVRVCVQLPDPGALVFDFVSHTQEKDSPDVSSEHTEAALVKRFNGDAVAFMHGHLYENG